MLTKNDLLPYLRLKGQSMRLAIKAKANASYEDIQLDASNRVCVHVRAPAQEGKANKRILELIAEILGIPKSRIRMVRGENNSNKELELQL